ncbi:hypothetical protein BCR44DRAFT_1501825 [Catenaria anguillulae PL171]|uniref:Uncharacterized protein n=1 Tax=Catenaria anguillulae PL171 TaxID=765915 RepID=A0A1Y2HDM6_9FUNG|nr:hypothetical protein BCR44DRAFT_1501825 [Catenaria anguillulae PL171]
MATCPRHFSTGNQTTGTEATQADAQLPSQADLSTANDLPAAAASPTRSRKAVDLLADLPNDVLGMLLSPQQHWYLAASDLVALACPCKLATSTVLPLIYARPSVPSLAALSDLCAAFESNRELATARSLIHGN